MQLTDLNNDKPVLVKRRSSPASLCIYFPSVDKTYEYVIYDDYEMDQLLKRHTRFIKGRRTLLVGKLVADLKLRKYTVIDVTADRKDQIAQSAN